MRSKKKGNQTQAVEKQPQNKNKTIITSDGKEYKRMDSILMKHSEFFKTYSDEEEIKLFALDSEAFEYILKFMDAHKENAPPKIHYPIKSNQDPKLIMDDPSADIVTDLLNQPDDLGLFKRVLDGSSYLLMEEFKKRLIAGLSIRLMKLTVGELKEQYEIKDGEINDDEMRRECRERLDHILEMKDD